MSFGVPFGSPFFSGGGGSALVPSNFHIAIAGRPYLLDTRREAGAVNGDIPIQREQTDTSADPGQQTLSTAGLWRRTIESWHLGAGQQYYDRREGNPFRFLSSEGVDPWTKYRLATLPDVVDTTAGTAVIALLAVNNRLYALSSSAPFLRYTTDLTSWTTVTGLAATAPTSMTTDGSYVYVAQGADGIYRHDVTGSTAASYATGTVSRVGFARGRLMASNANLLYNVIAAGALPAPLLTNLSPSFVWQGFAEGSGVVYAFGAANGVSRIYRTAIKEDGTALDVPVAASLPITGVVYAMGTLGDLGIIAGEDGWRATLFADNGDVILGSQVATTSPVLNLYIADRYTYLGLSNYSATRTGIARLDLSTDTASDTSRDGTVPIPAYATDLMATGQGAVTAVAELDGRRVFAVTGLGVFASHPDDTVTTATIDLGVIGFGIGDLKNALYADVRHLPLTAGQSVTVEVAKDNGAFITAGTSSRVGSVSAVIELGQLLAETINVRLTLTGGATLTMVTLRAAPAADVGEIWQLPLLLFDKMEDVVGSEVTFDVPAEREFLKALRSSRTAVPFQHGSETFTAIVESLREWREESMAYGDNKQWLGWWNGVQILVLKVVS